MEAEAGLWACSPPARLRPHNLPRACGSCFPPDLCTLPDLFLPPDFLKLLVLMYRLRVLIQPGVSREEPLYEGRGIRPVPGGLPPPQKAGSGLWPPGCLPLADLGSPPPPRAGPAKPCAQSRDGDAPDWAGPARRSSVWEAGEGRAALEGEMGSHRHHVTRWAAGDCLVPPGKCPHRGPHCLR